MKRVFQTRNVGMRPHHSGHVMAPMEIVYECVEPPRKRPTAPAFLIALAIVLVGLATLLLDYMTKK